MPEWVQTSVGIYAVLGSVFFVVLTVLAAVMLVTLGDIARQIKALSGKVTVLTERVTSIAEQVNSVTTEVGVRATGLARLVDDSASNAMRIVDFLAPVLVVIGVVSRLRGRRPRRR